MRRRNYQSNSEIAGAILAAIGGTFLLIALWVGFWLGLREVVSYFGL